MFGEKNRYFGRWPITGSLDFATVFRFKFESVTFQPQVQPQWQTIRIGVLAKTFQTTSYYIPGMGSRARKEEQVVAVARRRV
jgi:hypothetical protein